MPNRGRRYVRRIFRGAVSQLFGPRSCYLGIVINDLARFVDCNPTTVGAADMSPGLLWNPNHADATASICEAAIKSKTPLLIGTTAHSTKQRDDIVVASKQIPVVLASNFSVGVNALFALTENAARILGNDFDLEIVEVHHRMKKDAPSGTARTLGEILQRARQTKILRHGRKRAAGFERIGLGGERA